MQAGKCIHISDFVATLPPFANLSPFANLYCSQICIVHKFVLFANLYRSQICVVCRFVSFANLYYLQICIVRKFVQFANLYLCLYRNTSRTKLSFSFRTLPLHTFQGETIKQAVLISDFICLFIFVPFDESYTHKKNVPVVMVEQCYFQPPLWLPLFLFLSKSLFSQ